MSTAPNDSSAAVIKTDSEHNGWQNTSYCPSVNSSDFGHYFVSALLPHVKSFAYTWFHLQAAKRKHFKSEDKRMSFEEEQSIKTRLTNEPASAKIKWAVRLLMKLRKDIHKDFQSKLVDVIASSGSINGHNHQVDEGHCVVSNPDMKGKMRRIDCLRQSDKVWRLDLVMVVLFKGIPLESSDGERIDKLAQCRTPQLCINPNHALLNVRDLEVFLANYVNTSSASLNGSLMNLNSGKLSCNNNIFSPSVFTPQEFLNLSEIPITQGASDSEIKNSLSYVSSNTYCNEANEDAENGMPSLVGGGEHNDEENKDALRSLISQTAHERRNSTDSSTTAAVKNKDKSLSPSSSSQQQQQHTPKTKKMKLSNKNQDQVSSSATPTRSSNIKINEIIMQQQQQRILASTAAATNGSTPNLVKIDFDLNNHQRETQQQQEIESQTQSSGSKSKKKAANNAEEKTAGAVKRRRSSQQQKAAAVENGENNNDTSTTPKVARKNSKAKKEQQENESAPKQHQQMSLLVEDQSSSSTNMSQQDEEIKELLLINKNKIAPPQQQQQSASQQVVVSDTTTATEKLKLAAAEMMGAFHHHQHHNHLQHLHQQQQQPQIQNHHHIIHHYQSHVINAAPGSNAQIDANMSYGFVAANPNQKDEKEKQATADLFLQLLKAKEENQTSSSATSATTASSHLHQLSSNEPNSNPTYSDLLASTHLTSFIQQQQQQQQQQQGGNHQQHKATTPVFDHLLMSPLFSSMLPSSGSCSNSSTTSSSSSSSSSQTSLNGQAAAAGNGVPASSSSSSSLLTCNSFGQAFANNAAAAAAISAAMGLNANANTNKTTPSSSPITIGGDLSKLISSNHCSSFKRTKDKQQNNNNIKNQKINGAVNKQINQTATSQINSSLINALRFDTNSNGSYDELVSITGSNTNNSQVAASNTNGGENATHLHHLMMLQQQQQQGVVNKKISMSPSMGRSAHRPPSSLGGVDFSALASKVAAASSSTSGSTGPSSAANGVPLTGRNTPRIDDDSSGIVSAAKTGNSASNRLQNSSSPPPPPSIGKPVLNAATITSTSPTKLLQFYPFTSGSSSVVGGGVHVMHRPIPILQKPDSSSSTTTTTSNRSAPSVSIDEEVEEIAAESSLKSAAANRANSSSNSSSTTSAANNGSATTSKTPNELAAELIKIANSSQAQQHQSSNHIQQPSQQSLQQTNQLLSTLRSNSASNNSPLMFAINPNGACGSSNNFISFSSNSANLFASYPNISPANGMNGALIGGNCGGSASPTSSLFPSITSLFQSPIGTPRVTPTPQQYAAAYLFNDDQFHSLIYNTTSNQAASNSNGQTANNGCLVASNPNGAQQQEATSFIDAVATVQQTFHLANTADLSPLFNNLISAAVNAANNTNSSGSEQKTNNVLLSTTNN